MRSLEQFVERGILLQKALAAFHEEVPFLLRATLEGRTVEYVGSDPKQFQHKLKVLYGTENGHTVAKENQHLATKKPAKKASAKAAAKKKIAASTKRASMPKSTAKGTAKGATKRAASKRSSPQSKSKAAA